MSLSNVKIFKSKVFLILLALYIASHLLVININVAEWGDSYRILRAALSIERSGDYPSDEKRPPLMALVLSPRPDTVDPLMWGRIVIFFIGVLSFMLFFMLADNFFSQRINQDTKTKTYYLVLAAMLYMFNPVLFYWSIRVMTDVLFLLFVLLVFTVYYTIPTSNPKYVLLGLLVGLAILTRFEGYILALSLGLGMVLDFFHTRNFKHLLTSGVLYSVSTLFFVVPYFLYRNPFVSSYLGEPQGRAYDFSMVLVFIVSFIFLMGITGAFSVVQRNLYFYKQNSTLSIFLLLQIVLVLLWPAAVPRLFMPVIPFLVVIVALNFTDILTEKRRMPYVVAYLLLTCLFALVQYKLRLQFLLVDKYIFVTVLLLQGYIILALAFGKRLHFLLGVVLSCMLWSIATIKTHKDIYTTLIEASSYAVSTLEGDILHNDTASIIEWNLNDLYPFDNVEGHFKPLDNDKKIDYNELIVGKQYEYMLVTNEERPYFDFRPNMHYLEKVYSNTEFVNGANFYTDIYKINYE